MLAKVKSKSRRRIPEPRIAIGVRLSPEVKAALDEIAFDEGRSVSNLVQRALEEWLRNRSAKK
jgi:predicted transcriptional regulator